ncbi:hypothetical protein OG289_40530 [Streptomyces sp. NBC_01235]|nr:hypothetical protein OG289_40530 [Streptomyces sp. NBC_01235]
MTAQNELRLLPWSGPEGKPCYLSTDDRAGYMSRLADNIESEQLETAAELLKQAAEILGDEHACPEDMQLLAKDRNPARRASRSHQHRGHLLEVSEPHRF